MPEGPNSMGFAPRASSEQPANHIGAIVGGAVGGVALIAIIGSVVFFFVYRRRHASYHATTARYDGAEAEKPANGFVQPFELLSPMSSVFPSAPQTAADSSFSPSSSAAFFPSQTPSTVPAQILPEDRPGSLELAPPSYEISEGMQSPTSSAFPVPHEKSGRQASSSSDLADAQPFIPMEAIVESNMSAETAPHSIHEYAPR